MNKKIKNVMRVYLLASMFIGAFFGLQVTAHAASTYTISGSFTDRSGNPIQTQLCFNGNAGNTANVSTDPSGNYSVNVTPDTYSISMCNNYGAGFGKASSVSSLQPTGVVNSYVVDATNGNVTQNLTLDPVNVTFNVKEADGSLATNVYIETLSQNSGSTTLLSGRSDIPYSAHVTTAGSTDSNGSEQQTVLRGLLYMACATDNAISMSTCTTFTPTSDNSTVTINFPAYNTISGKFNNRLGKADAEPNISLVGSQGEQPILRYSAGNDGITTTYTANVLPDTYSLRVNYNENDAVTADISSNGYVIDANSGNVNQDLQIDNTTSNVQVKDSNGNPVEYDRIIAIATGQGQTSLLVGNSGGTFGGSGRSESIIPTDSNGVTSATLVSGLQYNICAQDPNTGDVSTVACTTFTPSDNNIGNVVITFPYPITSVSAPIVTAQSPTNHSPSLSWNSVNGVNYYQVSRDGTIIASTTDTTYVDTQVGQGSHTYSVEAANRTGYGAFSSNVTVVYDLTAPTISYSVSPTANSNGWNNTNATITFICSDSLSGVSSCTSPVNVSTEGNNQVITGTAVDNAGNVSTTTATVSIDKTAPTASSGTMSNKFILNSANETLSATAADSLSGVTSGEFYIDTDPGHGKGTAMTYSSGKINATTTISSLKVGSHKLYMRSKDAAGNWSTTTSVSFTYL